MREYYFITIFFIFLSCNQDKRVEVVYQECVYNSLSDKGESLKRFMKGFETHLVENHILKDSTPQSYYSLFKAIAKKTEYPDNYSYSYIDSINSIERHKINPYNKECMERVNSMLRLTDTKRNLEAREINFLLEDSTKNFFDILNKKLAFLEPEDFKLDYYQHQTFVFLYLSSFEHSLESIEPRGY